MRRGIACLFAAALFSCGKPAGPGGGPTASASAGVGVAPASSASAAAPALRPSSLARSATPTERRERDERACDANDVAACRRAADRYRGYGHIAGCGVERARAKPRRMVTADDAPADAKSYDRWIRRACDLGDAEACVEGKANVASSAVTPDTVDACLRSGLGDCPLFVWQAGMHPDQAKKLEQQRAFYREGKLPYFFELFRRDRATGERTPSKEIAELTERVCATTLECDDAFLMLDEDGYRPEGLVELRKRAGEVLVKACLAGDCTCGEAARYLDASDARIADLARIGCDDGEPDACFVLGGLYESGAGVEKNVETAFNLYSIACPPMLANDGREELYSKAACDRLAAMYEEGGIVEKDDDRAYFYASIACTRRGFERVQAPCIRKARYFARGFGAGDLFAEPPGSAAHEYFYGSRNPPVNGKECERPSVEALCKQDAKLVP